MSNLFKCNVQAEKSEEKKQQQTKPKYTFWTLGKYLHICKVVDPCFTSLKTLFRLLSWIFKCFLNSLSSSVCSKGIWKVVVKFQSSPQESFTADFEVKEYGRPFIPYIFLLLSFGVALDWFNDSFTLICQCCLVSKWNWHLWCRSSTWTPRKWPWTSKLRT